MPAMPATAPSLPRDSMQPISESTPVRGWAAAAPEGLGALPQGFAPDERRRRPTPPELQSPSSPSTSMGKDRESLRSFTPYSAAPSSPSGAGAGSKAASAGAFAEREFNRGAVKEPEREFRGAVKEPPNNNDDNNHNNHNNNDADNTTLYHSIQNRDDL